MIRNTDAMMKAVQVQKIKERIADIQQSIVNALAAQRVDIADIFRAGLEVEKRNLSYAYDLLKNPAA
jgi:hypothetical protein